MKTKAQLDAIAKKNDELAALKSDRDNAERNIEALRLEIAKFSDEAKYSSTASGELAHYQNQLQELERKIKEADKNISLKVDEINKLEKGGSNVASGDPSTFPKLQWNKVAEAKNLRLSNPELDKTPVYVPLHSSRRRVKTVDGIKEYDPILKRYYSSLDAELYFGNEYVEDICDITYHVNQNSLPIYGYNSYTFDELAVGSRLVQGEFSIRFTSPGYLFELLKVAQGKTILDKKSYVVPLHERNTLEAVGKVDNSAGLLQKGEKTEELWPNTFDIDIVYGQKSKVNNGVHVVLEDVRILSVISGASASNPSPLTETYSFVARDIRTLG